MTGSRTTSMLDALPTFRGKIMKWLAKFGVPPEDVEDLTQEVLSAAVRYSESFDPTKPLSPWLRRIARNIAIQYFKAKGDWASTEAVEEPAAQSETPERDAFDREMVRTLAEVFEELTPAERELLTLRFRDERSTKDIAALLSIPEPTVKSRIQRTLDRCFEGFRARGVEDRPGSLLVPLLFASRQEERTGGGSSNGVGFMGAPPAPSAPPLSWWRRVLTSRVTAFVAGGVAVYLLLQARQPPELAACMMWLRAFPVPTEGACAAPAGGAELRDELPVRGAARDGKRPRKASAAGTQVAAQVAASEPLTDFADVEGVDTGDIVPDDRYDLEPMIDFGAER
ncbi:sigma-70 family RNA polymerase sigma factor [Polyangium jinanense]|uniref:Sigma-70 family RNA polymerase sigma factor n=2 Tax=Polyangium jinanense TaxID=2829994 RepID=A0A9X3XDJ6_9BACT|nr:sigma-70 family RNA polymerase sigma factor [Polyangium jinanense]MDC3986111.1 sigma-70 family RNA polymerase sigma factor [Polyangium jinanense]